MKYAKKHFFAQKKILNHLTMIMQPLIHNFFINFFLVQLVVNELGCKYKEF